jgi:hypothetical protein
LSSIDFVCIPKQRKEKKHRKRKRNERKRKHRGKRYIRNERKRKHRGKRYIGMHVNNVSKENKQIHPCLQNQIKIL